MANFEVLKEHQLVASVVTAVLLLAVWSVTSAKQTFPEGVPWIGKQDNTLFATSRATFASIFKAQQWLAEGYQKFSQKGKTYVFPDLSGRHEIVIPNNRLRWLTDQSDSVSSVRAAHYDSLQGDYAFTDPYMLGTVYHEHVIHKNLARRVDHVIPAIWDELKSSISSTWGFDTERSKDILVWDNMMYIIARVSNRMFIGLPLCRNEDFLKNNSAFANDVITAAAFMPFFPKFLHPFIGRLMCIPNHLHYWRTRKYTLPIIKQRLADIKEKAENPASDIDIPDDYITWHIRTATAEGRKKELDPVIISRFLMPIEFAALHTTALTISMVMFDLVGSDPKKRFIEGIREEAERVYKEENGVWSKQALNKLLRADSAIRESMRHSTFQTRGLLRKVVSEQGLHNDEEGWTAPHGSFLSLNIYSRHHDPEIYPEPDTYDAFRFSRMREEYDSLSPEQQNSAEYLRMKNMSLISTGENFLSFGHGRHACPGRFLVQHELKMLLAYLFMNYDIEYLPERPPNQWMGTAIIPPMKHPISIKRKSNAVMTD